MNLHQQVIEPEEQHAEPDEKRSKCVKSSRSDDLRRVSDSRFHWSGCTKRKWWSDRHDWWLFSLFLLYFILPFSPLFILRYRDYVCVSIDSHKVWCVHTQQASKHAQAELWTWWRYFLERRSMDYFSLCHHPVQHISWYRWHCRNFPFSKQTHTQKKVTQSARRQFFIK